MTDKIESKYNSFRVMRREHYDGSVLYWVQNYTNRDRYYSSFSTASWYDVVGFNNVLDALEYIDINRAKEVVKETIV